MAETEIPESLYVIEVKEARREDHGLRVWSGHLRGLILSGEDVGKVRADIVIAITELLKMMGVNVLTVERAELLPYVQPVSGTAYYIVRTAGSP